MSDGLPDGHSGSTSGPESLNLYFNFTVATWRGRVYGAVTGTSAGQ